MTTTRGFLRQGLLPVFVLVALTPGGCGKAHPLAEVEGVLFLQGKPGRRNVEQLHAWLAHFIGCRCQTQADQ